MMVKELEAFTYSISDDMRGPLRAIDGFSRVLMDEYPDKLDSEGKRLLNIIRGNATQIAQLIDGLLMFSHTGKEPLDQSDTDMNEVARNAFEQVRSLEGQRPITVDIHDLPGAFADRNMIHQVYLRLLSNALKFTRPAEKPHIEIGCQADTGNQNVYFVRDNGVGFNMQYAGKLFGVFQRLHGVDEFEGTGVGLALVQRIVLRHGGRVWAEGKINGGATFYFSLPKA
jgi:light-regulated signal transduction histidine kinase (bacteriophytochrome)